MPISIAMALSGIGRDQWGSYQDLFDHGTKVVSQQLPRKPRSRASSTSSLSRSSTPTYCSKESGIASLSPEPPTTSVPLTLRDYCLFKLEAMQYGDKRALEIIEMFDMAGMDQEEKNEEENNVPFPVYSEQLRWTGRNLLDLSDNLKGNDTMYLPAKLPVGVKGYFENRSQISRVNGANLPPHQIYTCSGCGFQESMF